jgi:hypothetical protein
MLDDILRFLNTNSSIIQTIAVIVAVGYAAWQTRQLGRQLKLSNITSENEYFRDQNKLLLQNPKLMELRHETVEGCLADLYFGLFTARWELRQARLMSKPVWASDVIAIRDIFSESEFLRAEWPKRKNQYSKPFQSFIDRDILPFLRPSPPTPPS